jgi:heme/copper-type cytochrome/quinol oxidase subunit 2
MISEVISNLSYNEIEYFVYVNLLIVSLAIFYIILFMIIYSSALLLNSVYSSDLAIEIIMTLVSFVYIILIISPGLLLFLDYDFITSSVNFNVYILGYQWAWNYNILFNSLSHSFDQLVLSSSSFTHTPILYCNFSPLYNSYATFISYKYLFPASYSFKQLAYRSGLITISGDYTYDSDDSSSLCSFYSFMPCSISPFNLSYNSFFSSYLSNNFSSFCLHPFSNLSSHFNNLFSHLFTPLFSSSPFSNFNSFYFPFNPVIKPIIDYIISILRKLLPDYHSISSLISNFMQPSCDFSPLYNHSFFMSNVLSHLSSLYNQSCLLFNVINLSSLNACNFSCLHNNFSLLLSCPSNFSSFYSFMSSNCSFCLQSFCNFSSLISNLSSAHYIFPVYSMRVSYYLCCTGSSYHISLSYLFSLTEALVSHSIISNISNLFMQPLIILSCISNCSFLSAVHSIIDYSASCVKSISSALSTQSWFLIKLLTSCISTTQQSLFSLFSKSILSYFSYLLTSCTPIIQHFIPLIRSILCGGSVLSNCTLDRIVWYDQLNDLISSMIRSDLTVCYTIFCGGFIYDLTVLSWHTTIKVIQVCSNIVSSLNSNYSILSCSLLSYLTVSSIIHSLDSINSVLLTVISWSPGVLYFVATLYFIHSFMHSSYQIISFNSSLSSNYNQIYSPFYLCLFTNYLIVPLYSVISMSCYSFDVIHSFGFHSFGFKSDCIPGRSNHVSNIQLFFNGSFISYCYELCGISHTSMLSSIIIL